MSVALPAGSVTRSAGCTLKRVHNRCRGRVAPVLGVVWLLALAGAACQSGGQIGLAHLPLLGHGLSRRTSRQVVHHLGPAAVASPCRRKVCLGHPRYVVVFFVALCFKPTVRRLVACIGESTYC